MKKTIRFKKNILNESNWWEKVPPTGEKTDFDPKENNPNFQKPKDEPKEPPKGMSLEDAMSTEGWTEQGIPQAVIDRRNALVQAQAAQEEEKRSSSGVLDNIEYQNLPKQLSKNTSISREDLKDLESSENPDNQMEPADIANRTNIFDYTHIRDDEDEEPIEDVKSLKEFRKLMTKHFPKDK
jgi:hypothetical protein